MHTQIDPLMHKLHTSTNIQMRNVVMHSDLKTFTMQSDKLLCRLYVSLSVDSIHSANIKPNKLAANSLQWICTCVAPMDVTPTEWTQNNLHLGVLTAFTITVEPTTVLSEFASEVILVFS